MHSVWSAQPVVDVWKFREFFRQLVVRNLKVRYQRSLLGFLWLLANPVVTALTLVLVFGYVVRLPVTDYWAFLLSGYFAWVFLLHTVGTSTFVIPEHSLIARSVAVPPDIFVLSAAASRLIEFGIELLLALVVLAIFHHGGVPASFLLVPFLVVLLVLVTLGLAFPAAALAVYFRDIQHGLPAALMMLMYLSPVFYPADLVPPQVARLYFLNPVATILTLFHQALYRGTMPTLASLVNATLAACVVYAVGHATFRSRSAFFAEIV